MIPSLVPEISSLDAFCDTAVVGIGDSRSWMNRDTQCYVFIII